MVSLPLRGKVARYGGNGACAVCTTCSEVVPVKRDEAGRWRCGNNHEAGLGPGGEPGRHTWTPTKTHTLVPLEHGPAWAFCRACREAVVVLSGGAARWRCGRRPWNERVETLAEEVS